MKKHLLFNQSFGTEGSPNQTGETLTRENRIGLMSYLRRTLMLLFAVLMMSMANVGLAWGAEYALVSNPTGTPALTTNFRYGNLTLNKSTAATIDGIAFKKGIGFGSSLASISGKKAGENNIMYDVKTTSTKFTVYVAGATGTLYFSKIAEGATSTTVENKTISSNPQKIEFTLSSTTNTCVGFSVSSSSVCIYQIIAEETGTAHKQVGEAGYALNLNKGRYAGDKLGSGDGKSGKIDNNIEFVTYSAITCTSSTNVDLNKNTTDTYIKFTTGASAVNLKVTFSAGSLIVNTTKSTSGGTSLTSNTAQALAASTTYWIINTDASNRASITKIAFEAAGGVTNPSFSPATGNSLVKSTGTVTLASSGNTVYYKWSQTDNQYASGAGTTLAGAPDGSGTSPVNATAPSTAGTWYLYAVAKNGGNYSDVVKATYTITNPTHTLTWNLDGGTATGGTAAGAVAEGATLTAPTVTKVGYDFAGWSPAVPATMPAADATYAATWTKVYASGTYVFEGNNSLGTVPYNKTCGTGTNLDFRIDNIFFAGGTYEYDDTNSGGSGDGDNFNGWKWKTNNATIKFFVEEDCDVTIGIGSIGESGGATITYTNQSNVPQSNVALTAATNNVYKVKGGTLVTITHNNSGKTVTLKKIIISSASCPGNYSFHYGTNEQSDWTIACFEDGDETDERVIENFTIPTVPDFYVGWEGNPLANNMTARQAWNTDVADLGNGVMNGAMVLLPVQGTSKVGWAQGAIGTLRCWYGSTSKNQYVGFEPNGYAIMYGGNNYAFAETATEHQMETEVVTLPAVSTTYQMGIATADGYTTCAHSNAAEAISAMGVTVKDGGKKKILFNPAIGGGDGYVADDAKIAVYDVTNSTWDTDFMSDADGDGIYEGHVADDCETIIIARFNKTKTSTGDWVDKYNQTNDYSISGDLQKIYKIDSWCTGDNCKETISSTTTSAHPATGQKGKFRMWANSADQNWYVHFIPYYVLSYDANGGSGTTAATERNSESSTLTVSVASNGFTAPTGYHFDGWNTLAGGSGDPYAASADYTLTANATLYAQWSANTISVTLAKGEHGVANQAMTIKYDAGSYLTFTAVSANTGYTCSGYYDGETKVLNADGSFASSTVSGYITSSKWTKADNCTLTAKWTAKTYDVNLDDQDATTAVSPSSVTATYNSSTIASITNPEKTGYTFGGWYKSEAGENGLIISDAGALQNSTDYTDGSGNWTNDGDATIYAKWTQSVTIDDNGGSADGSVSVTYKGTAAAAPSGMTYAGHTADLGFYTESSCTNKVMNLDGTLVSDVTVSTVPWTNASSKWVHAGSSTLYAHWKCNTPEISCSSNTITISVPSGATVYYTTTTDGSTPADPTSSSTAYNPSSKPTISADTKIKAIAIQSGCTSSDVASADCKYVAECPSSASGSVVYKWEVKSNVTDGNICTTQNVAVSLNTTSHLTTLTGGTLQGLVTSSSTNNLSFSSGRIQYANGGAGVLILTLNCAVKTGDVIRFVNYSSSASKYNYLRHTSSSTTTNQITLNASTTAGTVQEIVVPSAFNNKEELYIVAGSNTTGISYFEIIRPYVVTLDASTNGGKVGGANTATYYAASGEEIVLPHAFKSGNYFNGWFPNASTGDAVSNPYTPTGSTTLYAQFGDCPDEGTVYKFQVATGLTNGNVTEGDVNLGNYVSALEGGSLTAHQNSSKLTIESNSKIQFADNNVYLKIDLDCALQTGDKFITSIETDKLCITNTGTRSTTNELVVGTKTETDVPAAFVGSKTLWIWRNGTNSKITYFEIVRPNGVTITGAVSPDGYGTVSPASIFVASGSTVSLASNVLTCDGKTLTASPASATAEYTYAFSSWSGVTNGGTVSVATTATANFTRTANNYTLAWSSNGGSDLSGSYTSGSTAYGASITAPNDPTLSNYTFDGWKTNNDGTGTTAGATMPAANTTYYAAWKQTVTLTTGAQGEGGNQTPYVYLNGTGVSSFTPHTASGYALQGYYTAGSGGVKVLNANGTFAAANVTDYITSGKWSRTGAAPTLYAQWVAAEDCSTSNFVIKKGDGTEYQGCMESSSYNGTATSFTAGSPTTVGNAKMTISNYDGGIKRPGSGKTFTIVIEPLDGYNLKSVCWAGKVESGETVSYYWDDNSGSATTISAQTTSGTGVTYNAPSSTTKFTASYVDDGVDGGGIWWRNVQVEVCAAGGTTYNVTYDGNDETGGTAPTDASSPYDYGATVTVLGNTGSLEKTNYTFAGWTTNDDGTGSSYVADNTFSITANTTLYAKWTQAVTLNKNGGSTDGSATAVWNATGLTGITHAKPASGYKLLGYYSASSDGTKVLNSDGSFAATNVTGYITSGKWSRTSATTLYAEYESAGALTWNLIVNSDTTNLSTSTKTSAFTEISTTNMTNATLAGDLTYEKSKKSALTGKISTPASYDADDYVYVTFQVASGYKFTPSSIKVIAQPVTTGKDVKLSLTDGAYHSLVSSSATSISGGSTQTVTLAGDGTYFTGTVTLKIYCYGATDKYRLGTPITIEGEIEEACGTMPSYTSMSYTTTTFAPGADASGSPITIVGGENIDTYQWKYNKVNDRTSGTNCGTGTSLTPLTDEGAATDGTRYYWCEMTNDACGITIKSPAVAITVAAAKSDATVEWTDPASTPNYGGGGYTIKATVNETGWDGNAADLVITAPAGIRIYNVSSGTTSSQKWVQADFDVQTSFDRTTYASNIPFTVSAAATATYNAISNDHNTAYSACAGAGEGSSYNIRVRKAYTKGGPGNNYYYWDNTDGWISSPSPNSSIGSAEASSTMATVFDSVSNTNAEAVYVRTYHDNIKKIRIYADFRANNMTVTNVYKHNDFYTANSKYEVDYSVIYNGDEENSDLGDAAQGYVDITLSDVMMSANDILLVKFNTSRVRPLGAVITESSAGSLNTYLQWSGSLADRATVAKYTTDAYFTYSASKITENTNTLGAITYSSSDPSVATVDATGKVALVADGETTIKATLAASGCYKKAEISYTLNVTEVPCAITAGTLTLTSGTESKCSSANVTLTLTGFESGASIQWKDGDTDINNGGNYTIATDNTTSTSTLTTDQPGTYSVMVTSDCSVRSNRITISNISATASVTKIVDEWYVKNGRLTPDIELWSLSEGATLKSVAWSPDNETGLSCVARGGVIYLEGKSPSSNDSGDIEYTLTATITDECNADHEETTKTIKITHQKNTDKHVLAFVVNGTAKGGFTEGITAAQTTSVGLYNAIAAQFDVQTTNIYATDDEKKLKEYYSQYDILCITDYPNTQTKGANSKSYVDAIGSLIDIRPILTMEAFVSKLANWKAKGISGNPSSPTTRQYTMLLQCKDHEIFAGTDLTKVGEGDETMYRVSMVDNTKEDYATLDATYGATLPHKEKESKSGAGDGEYNYGGKPALQGFTFTQEMSDNDLLPIGLIDDGAGNPLQVGIERQHNMEARLMVLGINSYAMERLTDDGERVVINALNYLMKKNQEDIADCSTAFVGGAEGDTKSWNNKDNWTGNTVPLPSQKVRILAECEVSSTVYALDVLIVTDGKYNHGSDNAAGKLTIKENGALIVGGKIQAASAPAYNRPRATTPDKLFIETSSTNQAALIFDNEEAETQATVNLYSLGSKPSSYQYQYFAVPMEVVPVNPVFANETHGGTGIYTYVYEEASSSWTRRKYYDDLFAFEGLGITTKSTGAMNYTMTGNLASTATKEITLTHDGAGLNLVGNSWMAPIQIGALAEDNTDANITQTVYIYCAGRDAEGGAVVSSDDTETAGQWLAVPFEAAEFETWKEAGKLSVIPAMQAFQIKVAAEATLTLDYDKVVRGSTNDLNAKLRAPGRRMAANEVTMTNIRVADSKTHTDLSLFEGDRFSEAFDNGWEAEYMNGDGRSAKLYAETEAGQMAVAAMYDYEGTVVGFAPGQETEYTFSFMGEDNGYYLNDIKLQNSVRISEGETYTFTYEEGDTENRFYISRTAINAPEVATGMENLDAAAPKVQKIIYNDKLYIIRGGRLYDATGKVVK